MGDKEYSKTDRAYWKLKTLLISFKITEKIYQIKHTKSYLNAAMGWKFSKLLSTEYKGTDDQDLLLSNVSDRSIRNAILDSPFTSEKIVKGTTLLKSKKSISNDSISNGKFTIFLIFLRYFVR